MATIGSVNRDRTDGAWSLGQRAALAVAPRLTAIFTADGPRGPIYQTKTGPVKLAAMTGEPVGNFYLLPERAWVLGSWDRFMVPKPFSRVVVSWGRKVAAPAADADAETLEAKRLELNAAMEEARLRAEAYWAGKSDGAGSR